MNNITVCGLQFGDESKARCVDFLAESADLVVRFGGGANAGHTVIVEDKKFVFHCIPSGILRPECVCVIGSGVVLDLESLNKELLFLQEKGVSLKNLKISHKCHVVTPDHKKRDAEREAGDSAIGTTKRGIGPCYSDKVARSGIRLVDLYNNPNLRSRLVHSEFGLDAISAVLNTLKPLIIDTQALLLNSQDKHIIFEGAQALMLDIENGTYPFVTSSSTHPGAVAATNGIPADMIGIVCGISKFYSTRVGRGSFPTEIHGEIGERIRQVGKEFGSTTGRPRRCGWLDLVQLKYAIEASGATSLILSKADVLAGISKLKVCHKYLNNFTWGIDWDVAVPEYLEVPGFPEQNWRELKNWNQASAELKSYVKLVEDYVNVAVEFISVGPERSNMLEVH